MSNGASTRASHAMRIAARLALTLLIGAVGGWIFSWLRMPLAWMLGAMLASTTIALGGYDLQRPVRLRLAMLAVLGVMMGSTFTPQLLDQAKQWGFSLLALTIFVAVVSAIGYFALRRWQGFDRPTAYFSSVPAGVNDMVVAGGAMGGDERSIALIHAIRILITVMVIPLWFRVTEGAIPLPIATPDDIFGGLSSRDASFLALAAVAGLFLGRVLHFPAPALVGPMLISAALHMSGTVQGQPPTWLINTAQVVVGVAIGCRFVGVPLSQIRALVVTASLNALYLLGAAALAAWLVMPYSGASFAALWLAFAPGGLAEMLLVGMSLGIDPAFVSAHHLFRVALVLIIAPLIYKALFGGKTV